MATQRNDITALCDACSDGGDQGVETILGRGEVDVNCRTYVGTPLQNAMRNNHVSIVRRLLSIPHLKLYSGDLYSACNNNRASAIAVFGQDTWTV